MNALFFDGELRLEQRAVPEPATGEALIRVTYAGICNTDLEIVKGYMGFRGVLGHEFVGVVERAPTAELVGRRVVGEINCGCGQCEWCARGLRTHCPNRTVLGIVNRDGAFAEYLTLPEENLHLVPDGVSDEVAVFTEPTAAAFRILEQVTVSERDRVVVLGDGKLGQLCAHVLWLKTRNLVCVGRHPAKLRLLEKLRIGTALDTDPIEPGADLVVEATGSPGGLQRAFELVHPLGTVILKTTVADRTPVNLAIPVIHELRVLGSRCGPFTPALEALALGTVQPAPMITARVPLADVVEGFRVAAARGAMKVLVHVTA